MSHISAHTPLTPTVLEIVQKPRYLLPDHSHRISFKLRVGAIVLFIYSHHSAEKLFI